MEPAIHPIMYTESHIPPPVLFNELKHHLGFIKHFIGQASIIERRIEDESIRKYLNHLGGSVMDIYTGVLSTGKICEEITEYLKLRRLIEKKYFLIWAGKNIKDFRIVSLSDDSVWTVKYNNNETRYVHLFPARSSPHTFRVKANTLKSAIMYLIFIGKDFITEEDLNNARAIAGLSPIREVADAEAITEMIEILRG